MRPPEELGLPPAMPSREEIAEWCRLLRDEVTGPEHGEMADWLVDAMMTEALRGMNDITNPQRVLPLSAVLSQIFIAGMVCGRVAEQRSLPVNR